VAVPPEKIVELLIDPAKHPLIDGSGTVKAPRDGNPERLELGAKFGMDGKIGTPYNIENTVVEVEENRLIAWRHFNGHRWRSALKPVDSGKTEITETFDWSNAKAPLLISISPFPRKD
jgi:hypothetical protein